MKILVTGGAGFIGSNFVRYWMEKYPKDKVLVFDKLTYAGHKENLRGLAVDFIQGDICDADQVDSAMKGIDLVVHFAAETHVDRSILGSSVFMNTNILGTHLLLQQALKHKVKLFHHVSTDEVFGSLPLNMPKLKFSENFRYDPHSPYSSAKASSDHFVRAWHDTYGLPITITNTSNNYGPYQDTEKLIPRFITNLIEGKKIPLMGKGENVRDWIYVLDHCSAIDTIIHAALDDPKLIGETFCVGGESERSNLQVTKAILKLMKKDDSMVEHIEHRLGHDMRYAIDNSKIKKVLGWKPKYKFEDWLTETVEWYIDNGWWWRPLKEGRPIVDPSEQRKI